MTIVVWPGGLIKCLCEICAFKNLFLAFSNKPAPQILFLGNSNEKKFA